MAAHRRGRWLSRALALVVMCAAISSVHADTLAAVERVELPALNGVDGPLRLANVSGRAVAIANERAWMLDSERSQWVSLAVPASLAGSIIGDGTRAFLVSTHANEPTTIAEIRRRDRSVELESLPVPTIALRNPVGTVRGDVLYLVGLDGTGQSHLLTFSPLGSAGAWTVHRGWPTNAPPLAIAVQSSGVYVALQGLDEGSGAHRRMIRWTERDGWQDRAVFAADIHAGSARAIGQAHVLFLANAGNDSASIFTYHAISDAWAELPYRSGVIVAAMPWHNGFLIASERSGSVAFETAQLASAERHLAVLDWIIIVTYLGAMIGVGVYFYTRHRQGSSDEFFVGSRSIPFWAAGISMYATNTSSISYIAIPAKAFETDWQYMMSKIVTVFGLMFVAVWIVPLLRRLSLVSVFNYLEMRFHPTIRMLASALCMLMHVGGRMSVVLFLPALAIATITGVAVEWSILIMGLCTIAYTALGGMRAVVWTDFTQVIVLMGGAIFAMGYIIYSVGSVQVYETAMAFDKTHLVNFSFDLTEPTVWGFVFLILFDTVLTFPKDQVLMQRSLATDSDRNAGRSIWIFAAMLLPGGLIFYGIGTLLFTYYKQHPDRLDPLLPIDATFPLFIAAELPSGLTGLIIAGIFAAAMGTLSSTINSVATLLSVDFYEKLARNVTQERSVRFAEWMTVVIGLIGIALALLLSRLDIHSLLDLTIELAGLLGGGFAGAYTLGMFTRRANSAGVSIGVATAIVVTLTAKWFDLVHPYFYLGISIFVCIAVGYVASLAFPAPTRSLAGLTIYKDT
jgi:solute:Na+ symporter, SSS family